MLIYFPDGDYFITRNYFAANFIYTVCFSKFRI